MSRIFLPVVGLALAGFVACAPDPPDYRGRLQVTFTGEMKVSLLGDGDSATAESLLENGTITIGEQAWTVQEFCAREEIVCPADLIPGEIAVSRPCLSLPEVLNVIGVGGNNLKVQAPWPGVLDSQLRLVINLAVAKMPKPHACPLREGSAWSSLMQVDDNDLVTAFTEGIVELHLDAQCVSADLPATGRLLISQALAANSSGPPSWPPGVQPICVVK